MDSATRTVPAGRMKVASEHRVPLSGVALDVLREAKRLDDGSGIVLPSPTKPGRVQLNRADFSWGSVSWWHARLVPSCGIRA